MIYFNSNVIFLNNLSLFEFFDGTIDTFPELHQELTVVFQTE